MVVHERELCAPLPLPRTFPRKKDQISSSFTVRTSGPLLRLLANLCFGDVLAGTDQSSLLLIPALDVIVPDAMHTAARREGVLYRAVRLHYTRHLLGQLLFLLRRALARSWRLHLLCGLILAASLLACRDAQ